MDSESADVFSKCSKISIVFTKLVIVLPVSKQKMNVSKWQRFKEISVTLFVRYAYPSFCYILSSSLCLTTLAKTMIIYRIVPWGLSLKVLQVSDPQFLYPQLSTFTIATSSLGIQYKTRNTFIQFEINLCSLRLFSLTKSDSLLSIFFEAAKECISSY